MINARYRIYCSFTVGYFYMNDLYMVHYKKDRPIVLIKLQGTQK